RQRFRVIDDERRIHQHQAIVTDQRRHLYQRIDCVHHVEIAEHRERPVFEREAEQAQRDCRTAHVRGVEHSDQLHGFSFCEFGCSPESSMARASTRSTEPCSYQSPSTIRCAGSPSSPKSWMAGRWVWPWIMRATFAPRSALSTAR